MYLGLDIGTSAVKAVVIDEAGGLTASASAPLDVARPRPGWSEQDPDKWVAAVEAVLDRLHAEAPASLAAVRGIGLSGQMHGATLLDAADRPLRPAILWNDGRSADEAAELDADPRFRELTGTIVFPGFTAPKLRWVARHEPGVFAATRSVLLPKDYVRLWLTGVRATDMSDASGTAWLDVARRRWAPELLAATSLDEAAMPALFEGTSATATVRHSLAARWGMGPAIVAAGAGDNAASACGVGAVVPGAAFASLGTSGVVFVATGRFAPNAASAVHAFCHAVPGLWHQMGVILSAAAALEWLAGIVGTTASDLAGRLGPAPAAPGKTMFLPYLSGERTPHNDTAIRGAFAGLEHGTDAASLAQAVLEGVGYALRDCLDALAAAGTNPQALTAVGGGARSAYWLQLIATILDLPVALPAEGDLGAAFGAARLGLIAATGAEPAAVCRPPATARMFMPQPDLVAAFAEAHARWQRLYPAIKGATA